jgi:quercetin dioxygenase-like cupin family protein
MLRRSESPALCRLLMSAALCLPVLAAADEVAPSDTVITPLLEKPLSIPATSVASMLTVEYAPGASTPAHRHPADTFVYVLEGAIEMQVGGGPLTVLKAGDTFYESPQDQHLVSRNASDTEKAKFLVFFVKEKGAPVLEPIAQ